MAYLEHGEGDPIVFLHGNPTSSYLWRNIMPSLAGLGRLIAPDLIGMGDSQKLDVGGPNRYSYAKHREYLFALLDELEVKEKVTLVLHDWGSGLGFTWAHQNQEALKGIAFLEAIVAPIESWEHFPQGFSELIKTLRSDAGEDLILEGNIFIEEVLPQSILRSLTSAEMTEYRRPFLNPGEARRPTLSWPRQIPIAGEPRGIDETVRDYSQWLRTSEIPKLFINAEPGALMTEHARELVRSWPQVTEITVPGIHFVQEDSPLQIGDALVAWYSALEHRAKPKSPMRVEQLIGPEKETLQMAQGCRVGWLHPLLFKSTVH